MWWYACCSKDILKEMGCQVHAVAEGQEPLKAASRLKRIDLLVSDIGLPGLNGPALAEKPRASQSDLKILFVSGYAEEVIARRDFLGPDYTTGSPEPRAECVPLHRPGEPGGALGQTKRPARTWAWQQRCRHHGQLTCLSQGRFHQQSLRWHSAQTHNHAAGSHARRPPRPRLDAEDHFGQRHRPPTISVYM